jgi:uncharacterized protein
MVKKYLYLLTLSVLIYTISIERVYSQNIPERPNPPRLVNDFAGMLKPEEVNMLERKLDSFNDTTSNQIAIVIVPTLGGDDKADYAQRLGEKWGVGQKGRNNGILILVKPKQLIQTVRCKFQPGMVPKDPFPILPAVKLLTGKFFLLSGMKIIMVD